jgi:hypothetical protein
LTVGGRLEEDAPPSVVRASTSEGKLCEGERAVSDELTTGATRLRTIERRAEKPRQVATAKPMPISEETMGISVGRSACNQ